MRIIKQTKRFKRDLTREAKGKLRVHPWPVSIRVNAWLNLFPGPNPTAPASSPNSPCASRTVTPSRPGSRPPASPPPSTVRVHAPRLRADGRARSSIGKADGHPRSHRKKQGKMSEFVGTRRNLCLFIVERISNNTEQLAPNPGLTLAGGPARLDASNDTAGR